MPRATPTVSWIESGGRIAVEPGRVRPLSLAVFPAA